MPDRPTMQGNFPRSWRLAAALAALLAWPAFAEEGAPAEQLFRVQVSPKEGAAQSYYFRAKDEPSWLAELSGQTPLFKDPALSEAAAACIRNADKRLLPACEAAGEGIPRFGPSSAKPYYQIAPSAAAAPMTPDRRESAPPAKWVAVRVGGEGPGAREFYYDQNEVDRLRAGHMGVTAPLYLAKDKTRPAKSELHIWREGTRLYWDGAENGTGMTQVLEGEGGVYQAPAAAPPSGPAPGPAPRGPPAGPAPVEPGGGAPGGGAKPEPPAPAPEIPGGAALTPPPDPNDPQAIVAQALAGLPNAANVLGARLSAFLWKERGAASFHDAKAKPARLSVDAAVSAWAGKVPGDATAIVYLLLMGEKAPPAWAHALTLSKNPKLGEILERLRRAESKEDALVQCLARWSVGKAGAPSGACAEVKPFPAIGPLKGGEVVAWADAFFDDAAAQSRFLLAKARLPSEIAGDIDKEGGPTTPPPPGGTPPGPAAESRARSGPFGIDELFGAWGDANVFSVTGMVDGKPVTRVLALVLRAQKTSDNPPKFADALGLYDISDPNGQADPGNSSSPKGVYGKRFDFKDLQGKDGVKARLWPGGVEYSIQIGENGGVRIGMPGAKNFSLRNSQSGDGSLPGLDELYRLRVQRARESARVWIDPHTGKAFYVSAESSAQEGEGDDARPGGGSLLYWEKGKLDAYDLAKGARLGPDLMAYVNKKDENGNIVRVGDSSPLGEIGGKWRNLQWNKDQNYWEPVVGKPPEPKKEKPKEGKEGEDKGAGKDEGAGGGGQADGVKRDAEGWPLFESGKPYAKLNGKLAEGLRGKVRFYENPQAKTRNTRIFMVFDKDAAGSMGLPYMGLKEGAKSFGEDIIGDHVLMTKTEKGAMFIDLGKVDPKSEGNWWEGAEVGVYNPKGGANMIDKVKDLAILRMVLETFLTVDKKNKKAGYNADEIPKILDNAKKALGKKTGKKGKSEEPEFYGSNVFIRLRRGEMCQQVWPHIGKISRDCDDEEAAAFGGKKGIAFSSHEPASNSTHQGPLPEELEFAGEAAKAHLLHKDAAGLYVQEAEVEDGKGKTKKVKKYFVAVKVKGKDGEEFQQVLSFGDAVFMSSSVEGVDAIALPSGLSLAESILSYSGELAKAGVGDFALRIPAEYAEGDLSKKGAYALFTTSAGDVTRENQCLGAVLWWGVSKDDAEDACETDGKL